MAVPGGAAPVAAAPHHAPAKPKPAPANQVAKTEPQAATAPAPDAEADSDDDQDANGVAAIVNDQVVSEYDLRQRVQLVMSTSGLPPTPANAKRFRPQVLEQLKTEKLELIEAQRKNITVSPTEVDKEIEGILTDNKLTMDQLKQILGKSNVAMETLRTQIAVQLAWQKAIEDEYGDRINITPQDIDDELARAKEGADKPHYLVSEIFLPVEAPDQDDKVKKSAEDLVTQMQNGAPFPSIARQFSQSPSAAEGGDIGWVHDGQLAPELNAAVSQLKPGGVSPPVRSSGGYYILALRQRQEGEGTKVAPAPPPPPPPAPEPPKHPGYLPLARFLLPLPPKAPKDYVDKVAGVAGQIRAQNPTCAMLQKIAATIKGSVFMNLGEMHLADLSPEIQGELAKTESGEATVPFRSSAGIEILGRCDKQAPKPQEVIAAPPPYKTPTRDEVERRLFQQQISMLARRYIRDLRREANVETR